MTMTANQDKPHFILSKTTLIVIALIICASLPRLYQLGDLSFYMDEETTAFASRALAEGNIPQMPSGMPYYRSLADSWMNAMSARIFGIDSEFSYRLPAALFGILTIPLIFLIARPVIGTHAAILAALLLAFSEWHILTSRQARMYAPFLFFYTACAFSALQWARRNDTKWLLLTTALFIPTVTLHNIGVFAAFVPLIALFIKGFARTPQYKLLLFSILGGISAFAYGKYLVSDAYHIWIAKNGIQDLSSASDNALTYLLPGNTLLLLLGITGIAAGIWLGRQSAFTDQDNGASFRLVVRYVLAMIAGWLAGIGYGYGSALAILLLLLQYPDNLRHYLKQTFKPLLALGLLVIASTALVILDNGLSQGIKNALSYPYPYWLVLAELSLVMTLLFALTNIYLATTKNSENNLDIRAITIIGLFPIILVGFMVKWAPVRYFIEAYPFILLVCAYLIFTVFKYTGNRYLPGHEKCFIAGAYLVVLSGLISGHGIYAAYNTGTATHGSRLNEAALIFPVYPDHKHPGEFVAKNRKPNDIVIAEDALQQKWYAERVDYWLRNFEEEAGFLYLADDKELHDIYVDSIAATHSILNKLLADKSQRFWIITSGETFYHREFYLNNKQREWLDHIEENFAPVFTGQDSITQVYCIHCDTD